MTSIGDVVIEVIFHESAHHSLLQSAMISLEMKQLACDRSNAIIHFSGPIKTYGLACL